MAKPFVKWVGGKRALLPVILEKTPKEYSTYYEPFVGGGAVFFGLRPKQAVLSDINTQLITTYEVVRDDVTALITELQHHADRHTPEYFSEARTRLGLESDIKQAGLFIYLNKTCFNGVYRVNSKGRFNVPLGDNKKPNIVDTETLMTASRALQGCTLMKHSFEYTKIEKGAFYYLDPPYHKTFSQYDQDGFGEEHHKLLAEFCDAVDKGGGYFMLSNSITPFITQLYKQFNLDEVSAPRVISQKADGRKRTTEYLIRNYS